MTHETYTETLRHYACALCSGRWSIGDGPETGDELLCPQCGAAGHVIFIREQQAEDAAVEAMESAHRRGDKKGGRPQAMREVYAAIRDGEIPGVRLEGE